jgi:predicted transcriptional regulator of viral defense system
MTRPLSRAAAKIVERLELEQAFLVTLADLRDLMDDLDVRSEPKLVAKRLRDHGWLLPTAFPGVWEFAPGSQAGPYPRGHPFREVVAAHRAHPELDLAVGLTSALWAHGLTDRSPDRPEVAVTPGARVPAGLTRVCRVVRFEAQLPPVTLRDAPVHALATVLVHLAARPTDVRSWGGVLDVLPDLVAAVAQAAPNGGRDALERELHGRPASVRTRLAYLLHGVAPGWAAALAPSSHGKVWFGPRGPLRRHHAALEVADTILPMSPGDFPSTLALQ